jgi:hypothetical protein
MPPRHGDIPVNGLFARTWKGPLEAWPKRAIQKPYIFD